MPRGSAPGERRGGRKAGTPNHITARVRDAVVEALEGAEGGAVGWLSKLSDQEPKAFASLVGKLIPQARELTGADLFPEREKDWRHMTFEERMDVAKRIAFMLNVANHAIDKGQFPDGVRPSTEVST
jgi:hypothetical protein